MSLISSMSLLGLLSLETVYIIQTRVWYWALFMFAQVPQLLLGAYLPVCIIQHDKLTKISDLVRYLRRKYWKYPIFQLPVKQHRIIWVNKSHGSAERYNITKIKHSTAKWYIFVEYSAYAYTKRQSMTTHFLYSNVIRQPNNNCWLSDSYPKVIYWRYLLKF